MIYYNTTGNRLKRGLLNFTKSISDGFTKPTGKFIADMVYGMIGSGSCKLTEIGRELKEEISFKKTVDRLGRNLSAFSEKEVLMTNYLAMVRPYFGADTMLLIDGGDVTKPCSPKMEAIGSVYDASESKYGDGYWTMGAVALTENGQPIPVYENLYPCKAQGGDGFSAETKRVLEHLRKTFGGNVPRIFDRGFDSGNVVKELCRNNEAFILRVNQNRVVVHNGKETNTEMLVVDLICVSKRLQKYSAFMKNNKFFLYAVFDGISCVLAHLRTGISHFFKPNSTFRQLCFDFP
ncbi:MAG: transposase [Endomicrobia bacterium]|nr:transposase [Endomicrobiia bacterium]